MLYIFDLDHTVIDSSHRQITRADGSLDLDAWIENSTRKKIFQDRMLPLADIMRNLIADKSHKVAICTARNLSKHDYDFIRERGLFCDHILARQNGDNRPDDELKYSKMDKPTLKFAIIGVSIISPEGFAINPLIPANCFIWA